jgi:glycine C-acetyltransferase/8-amino-7-oxononanoate synthase
MVRYLVNTARPLIFSTAPGPPAVAGALAALELLQERPHRVARLRAAARALRSGLATEGFPVQESEMGIVPLVVGEERAALRMCQAALERGVFAQAIRPPTVPVGTSRLRLAVMASHTPAELRRAARTLAEAAREAGLEPAAIRSRAVAPRARPARGHEQDVDAAPHPPQPLTPHPQTGAARGARQDAPFDIERETRVARAA